MPHHSICHATCHATCCANTEHCYEQTYRDIFRASMSLNSNLMKIYVIQPVKKIGGLYLVMVD